MIDPKRMELLIRLARFEKGEGKKDLAVSSYYARSYIGFALLKNFFLATLAYVLIWGIILLYNMDYVLANLNQIDLKAATAIFASSYVLLLGLYSVVVFVVSAIRHQRAMERCREYEADLRRLRRLYDQEQEDEQEAEEEQ